MAAMITKTTPKMRAVVALAVLSLIGSVQAGPVPCRDADTVLGLTNSAGIGCGNVDHKCGTDDTAEFSSKKLCCHCGGGTYPQDTCLLKDQDLVGTRVSWYEDTSDCEAKCAAEATCVYWVIVYTAGAYPEYSCETRNTASSLVPGKTNYLVGLKCLQECNIYHGKTFMSSASLDGRTWPFTTMEKCQLKCTATAGCGGWTFDSGEPSCVLWPVVLDLLGVANSTSGFPCAGSLPMKSYPCQDTDKGAVNAEGFTCSSYTNAFDCGEYDTDSFNASAMCCFCGGGTLASTDCLVTQDEQVNGMVVSDPYLSDMGVLETFCAGECFAKSDCNHWLWYNTSQQCEYRNTVTAVLIAPAGGDAEALKNYSGNRMAYRCRNDFNEYKGIVMEGKQISPSFVVADDSACQSACGTTAGCEFWMQDDGVDVKTCSLRTNFTGKQSIYPSSSSGFAATAPPKATQEVPAKLPCRNSDTILGVTDANGASCLETVGNTADDDDFICAQLCCQCGGGTYAKDTCSLWNQDLTGTVISSLGTVSEVECETACEAEVTCDYWVLAYKAGVYACQLRKAVTALVTGKSNYIIGLKCLDGCNTYRGFPFDTGGGDAIQVFAEGYTVELCQLQCGHTSACGGWTHASESGMCTLWPVWVTEFLPTYNATMTSGFKCPKDPPTVKYPCQDINSSTMDSLGGNCNSYTDSSVCGDRDTGEFTATEMCCLCGGGMPAYSDCSIYQDKKVNGNVVSGTYTSASGSNEALCETECLAKNDCNFWIWYAESSACEYYNTVTAILTAPDGGAADVVMWYTGNRMAFRCRRNVNEYRGREMLGTELDRSAGFDEAACQTKCSQNFMCQFWTLMDGNCSLGMEYTGYSDSNASFTSSWNPGPEATPEATPEGPKKLPCRDADTDLGVTNSVGGTCPYNVFGCGGYDDADFNSSALCCYCGGGTYAKDTCSLFNQDLIGTMIAKLGIISATECDAACMLEATCEYWVLVYTDGESMCELRKTATALVRGFANYQIGMRCMFGCNLYPGKQFLSATSLMIEAKNTLDTCQLKCANFGGSCKAWTFDSAKGTCVLWPYVDTFLEESFPTRTSGFICEGRTSEIPTPTPPAATNTTYGGSYALKMFPEDIAAKLTAKKSQLEMDVAPFVCLECPFVNLTFAEAGADEVLAYYIFVGLPAYTPPARADLAAFKAKFASGAVEVAEREVISLSAPSTSYCLPGTMPSKVVDVLVSFELTENDKALTGPGILADPNLKYAFFRAVASMSPHAVESCMTMTWTPPAGTDACGPDGCPPVVDPAEADCG
eukprot:CAMPEP_0203905894 /NCGR_PEP_ID=MMETSP0359-20131031/47596_1 /ASSEMBLY_ACC=CAM_ASM_000338 /TAXON_ID=268821 /ORGANISM="Scrippsiella Hangoei, Strain SHTV-5" /LENGTH=1296 /DNA_ID=CAMNT_0050830457 /DNA_START=61 /DNA_END=3947 /DNA_ORIENTATION=-